MKAVQISLRLFLAFAGGYAIAASFAALVSVALPAVGALARSEAVVLSSMLAFLVYLALLIWAFAEPRLCLLYLIFSTAAIACWAGTWGFAKLASGS